MKKYLVILFVGLMAAASTFAHNGSHKKLMGTIANVENGVMNVQLSNGHESAVRLTVNTRFDIADKPAGIADAVAGRRCVVEMAHDGTAEAVHLGKIVTSPK